MREAGPADLIPLLELAGPSLARRGSCGSREPGNERARLDFRPNLFLKEVTTNDRTLPRAEFRVGRQRKTLRQAREQERAGDVQRGARAASGARGNSAV